MVLPTKFWAQTEVKHFHSYLLLQLLAASDSDISNPASGHILVHDGSDSFDNVAISGDITLLSNGAVTIANDSS